ncbi:MAG: zinc metallopeptidase [Puniceicoccales bacterium]|nr:zinc metallopeptidase [Puniceicoccales bacterium]
MDFWNYQTNLYRGDAEEAVRVFWNLKNSSTDRVTSAEVISQITRNSILRDVCKIAGITWELSKKIDDYLIIFFKQLGRILISIIMLPCSVISNFVAGYICKERLLEMRNLMHSRSGTNTTLGTIVKDHIRSMCGLSSNQRKIKLVEGEKNSADSCYYDPLHDTVSLPKFLLEMEIATEEEEDSHAAEALAIAFHELGHAEQHKILFVLAIISIAIAVISTFFFIEWIGWLCLFFVIAMPVCDYFIERDASRRSIVNLIANRHISNEKQIAKAVTILQYAACSYLCFAFKNFIGRVLSGIIVIFS